MLNYLISNSYFLSYILVFLIVALSVLLGIIIHKLIIFNKLKAQVKLGEMAFVDVLTGGGNRAKILKDMDLLIINNVKFALCFMDLDGFKQINDTMGHDAGDQLLIILYNLLNKKLPENTNLYRIGGDEFAITITDFNSIADISKIIEGLKKELSTPIKIKNTEVTLEYSMGIAIYPTDATNKTELISYADDAMYFIKENGKANYHFHNKVLKAKMENKNKMEIDLKKAYEKGEFGIEFQPRIDLLEKENIILQALSFWNHPVLGYMKAEYFVKSAQELGIILNLDEYVLINVCKKLSELKKNGFKNVKFAVNISKIHTKRKDFIDRLCNILADYELEKGDILLEFTEPIDVHEIDNYKNLIDRVKEYGVRITTANLEIEYDSLKLIKQLNIDELKINVKYLDKDTDFNEKVFTDIVKLGKDLDYRVIATHIEDKSQYAKCIEHKVDKIQGNFVFKRIRLEDLEDYIQNYKKYLKNLA